MHDGVHLTWPACPKMYKVENYEISTTFFHVSSGSKINRLSTIEQIWLVACLWDFKHIFPCIKWFRNEQTSNNLTNVTIGSMINGVYCQMTLIFIHHCFMAWNCSLGPCSGVRDIRVSYMAKAPDLFHVHAKKEEEENKLEKKNPIR